jgi:hypothetical protein
MLAFCRVKEGTPYFYVSAEEVLRSDPTPEAKIWVAGFLAGCEPPPPVDEDYQPLPFDDPESAWWRDEVERFAQTGYWCGERLGWEQGPRRCEGCGTRITRTEPQSICSDCGASGLGEAPRGRVEGPTGDRTDPVEPPR